MSVYLCYNAIESVGLFNCQISYRSVIAFLDRRMVFASELTQGETQST
jgi:hypothetical protein